MLLGHDDPLGKAPRRGGPALRALLPLALMIEAQFRRRCAMKLSLKLLFLCCFNRCRRFGNMPPSIIWNSLRSAHRFWPNTIAPPLHRRNGCQRETRRDAPAEGRRCARPFRSALRWRSARRRPRYETRRCTVAGALHHTPVMHGDSRVDQIAPERPQPRQYPILVGASKPAVSDHVRYQNRCELPGFGQMCLPSADRLAQPSVQNWIEFIEVLGRLCQTMSVHGTTRKSFHPPGYTFSRLHGCAR